jgi:GT2 family glycosyltransferase
MRYRPSDLTVVVPTRGRSDVLRRTVAALEAQSATGFQVIVVVDGLDQHPPTLPGGVRVLQVEHGGPGVARNRGVAASPGPLLLFLGDDMIPAPDLVARHLDRHDRDGGRDVAVLGRVEWHPEVARTPLLQWIDDARMQFDYAGIEGEDAGWGRFYSCNVSLPRELFDRAGQFDPAFTYYYEDLDLAYRLRDAGMQLRYQPAALARHLHSYDEESFERRLRGIAAGEFLLTTRRAEFAPYFANRFRSVEGQRNPTDRWLARFAPAYLDAFEAEQELAELKEYLGADFDEMQLRGHRQVVDAEEAAATDELTFYRTSRAYLYDLTVFAMSGTKRPYRELIRQRIGPGSRLLDYGCGIGSDGLRFLEAGYRVEFADYANPSATYLRWRLDRRGIDAAIYDVEQVIPNGFEVAYCFDVIEHVDDPFDFLGRLEATADLVAINFLEPLAGDVHVHKPLPIRELLRHAARHGIVHYSRHHDGRSHFVIYHSMPADAARRLLGQVRRARARWRS